jgi:CRP-like cAMP-binding protein
MIIQPVSLTSSVNESATDEYSLSGPRLSVRFLTQVSQSATCNRFHQVEARLARWLLMTHDRMETDDFRLTQEFMSNMLGVRREGINKAAGMIQKPDLISYSRGHVRVLNRVGLEAIACQCYAIIKNESDDFLNGR